MIRLPRILVAALCGASLAAAGVLSQGLFRNPLASPSILGSSSASATVSMFYLSLGVWEWYALPLAGIVGAMGVCILLLFVVAKDQHLQISQLLLGWGRYFNAPKRSNHLSYFPNDRRSRQSCNDFPMAVGWFQWMRLASSLDYVFSTLDDIAHCRTSGIKTGYSRTWRGCRRISGNQCLLRQVPEHFADFDIGRYFSLCRWWSAFCWFNSASYHKRHSRAKTSRTLDWQHNQWRFARCVR